MELQRLECELQVSPPPIISVILPTYNREKLVFRAIDSILAQKASFELIIIDDGSTDDTLKHLQAIQDRRVSVITKKNGGVSSARNLGLQYAQGKYVTFVDSDDYLLDGFFEDAMKFLEIGDLDMLFYGGKSYYKGEVNKSRIFWDTKRKVQDFEAMDAEEFFKDFCLYQGNSWACAKFTKRELAQKVCFDEKITYGEDLVFNLECVILSSKIGLRDRYFYFCDQSSDSLCRGQVKVDEKSINLLMGHQRLKEKILNLDLRGYCAFNTAFHISGNCLKLIPTITRSKGLEKEILNVFEEVPEKLYETHKTFGLACMFIAKFKKINLKSRFVFVACGLKAKQGLNFVIQFPIIREIKPRTRLKRLLATIKQNKK